MNDPKAWVAIGKAALHRLDVSTASRAYRQIGGAAMVMALQKLELIEDRNHLSGSIMVLLADYSAAQEFFLASSAPQAALELRRDLLQWDQALQLANTLAPEEVPIISREYAQQLELKGDDYTFSLFFILLRTSLINHAHALTRSRILFRGANNVREGDERIHKEEWHCSTEGRTSQDLHGWHHSDDFPPWGLREGYEYPFSPRLNCLIFFHLLTSGVHSLPIFFEIFGCRDSTASPLT
jgi:hypothetical protein